MQEPLDGTSESVRQPFANGACAEPGRRMNYWLVLGILLAGCGVGAVLTAAVHLTQLRKVKTDLRRASHISLENNPQFSPHSDDRGREEKSA
jgi:hypothetical protein